MSVNITNVEIENQKDVKPDSIKNADLSPIELQELEKEKQKVERMKEEVARMKQDTADRKTLARWVRWIVPLWLIFTAFMFIFYGDKYPSIIICTLLGTTTANIIGLGYILLKGVFPENKEDIK